MSEEKKDQMEQFSALMGRFIGLSNEMKNEGRPVNMIGSAMMYAAATYATYTAAGNEGYLEQSGVDKVVAAFRQQLTHLQQGKKQQLNPDD